MQDSIFTKIIKGEIPSHKVYENETVYAFLDIHPVREGHILVVPKEQIEFVWDLPENLYDDLMRASKEIALRLRDVIGTKYVHERIVGTDVPHAHVHLIPFDETSELSYTPDADGEPDHEALAGVAAKLKF